MQLRDDGSSDQAGISGRSEVFDSGGTEEQSQQDYLTDSICLEKEGLGV